jgi:hypothetical protein
VAIYKWNGAEEKMIDSVLEIDELRKRVPRLESFYEGVQHVKGWLTDNSFEGKFTNSRGWTSNRQMKRIGSVPYSVAAAIKEIHPEAFKNRAWTYEFLRRHPEYSVESD